MNKKLCHQFLLLCFFIFLAIQQSFGQAGSLDIGLRFQKTLNLYHENGFTAQYFPANRIAVGVSYITSRLGSAIGSNAIKQDNLFVSGTWLFRPNRSFKPFLRGNIGWFYADYEVEKFDALPNTSPLLSFEGGLAFPVIASLHLNTSLGYNLITGNGFTGPGTLYPLFYQLSLNWRIRKPN
jgi:hypothetical protein